jgi:hypothetical protein
MVNRLFSSFLLLAEKADDTVLERLDPDRRAAVIAALVGLVLLGTLLVVVVMLAGRWARHRPSQRKQRFAGGKETSFAPPPREPKGRQNETLIDQPGDGETKA